MIFSISVDIAGNFYLNGNLIDIYRIPYYSVIAPKSFDLATKGTSINFDNKSYSLLDKVLSINKTNLLDNNLILDYYQ